MALSLAVEMKRRSSIIEFLFMKKVANVNIFTVKITIKIIVLNMLAIASIMVDFIDNLVLPNRLLVLLY